jgi:predicted dehydrogenase
LVRNVAVADMNAVAAAKEAHQYGLEFSTGDCKSLISNPAIYVVSITTPNSMHKEMALAAFAAGKHVHSFCWVILLR